MSVLMLFMDGIGIGEFDESTNPFVRFPTPFFPNFRNRPLLSASFDGVVVPTDPSMDVDGLPQSATGQTALLTGKNAARVLGHHHSGFPTTSLRQLLQENSIFLKLERMNRSATFANAFTPEYFKRNERFISATTWSVRASKFPFRMLDPDLLHDQAISHDLTNKFLSKLGYDVPIRQPEAAAEILARIAKSVDFCLFEYFMTDLIGHSCEMDWAGEELEKLNKFLQTLFSRMDLKRDSILLTSDHGNFEDLSTVTHTNNLVPTTIWGKGQYELANGIKRIEDVADAILAYLRKEQE